MPTYEKPYSVDSHVRSIRSKLAYLESLGSPLAIAEFLEDRGITGRKHSPWGCPIANYLSYQEKPASVGFYIAAPDLKRGQGVRLPLPVFSFIKEFDAGRFPYLDEESSS